MKSTTKLSKLFTAFCAKNQIEESNVRFMFDGIRLQGDQTVAHYEFEPEDVIDCMVQQVGGGTAPLGI